MNEELKNKQKSLKLTTLGFTLIELLAVIVILAIIALIAIPIVLNIISDVNKNSTEVSMKNIDKAASLYFQQNRKEQNIIFECSKGICKYNNEELEISGKSPESGKILLDKKGNITYEDIVLNGFNCYKEHEKFVCDTKKIRKTYNESKIVLNSESEYNLFDYNIYGNSIQNAETLQYESVGDKTKNLFDIQNQNPSIISCVLENIYNGIKITSVENGRSGYIAIYLNSFVTKGKIYTISFKSERSGSTGGGVRVTVDGNLSINLLTFNGEFSDTFTAGDNNILYFYANTNSGAANDFAVYTNVQLEEGSSLVSYEPHNKYKIPVKVSGKNILDVTNIYLDEPLRSYGEKSDYIDFKNSKVIRYIEEDSLGNLKVLSIPKEEKIELPEILLKEGINNIEIETSIKPSKIELEYIK